MDRPNGQTGIHASKTISTELCLYPNSLLMIKSESMNAFKAIKASAQLGINDEIERLKAKKKIIWEEYEGMVKNINQQIEQLEVDKTRRIEDCRKDRFRLVLRLRSQGKTFQEIGRCLGCCGTQSQQIYNQAIRFNNRQRL